MEQQRDGLVLSTDPERMDVDAIHEYLSQESYWAHDIPLGVVARALANSLCFGVFDGDRQVALARVVTDFATYAYVCDVYVLESHRRRGIGHWMLEAIDSHPDLQGLRRWSLITRDAHSLYEPHGYVPLAKPENYLERVYRDAYVRGTSHSAGGAAE
jgi:GNAT superfamily N-acetyltransferase